MIEYSADTKCLGFHAVGTATLHVWFVDCCVEEFAPQKLTSIFMKSFMFSILSHLPEEIKWVFMILDIELYASLIDEQVPIANSVSNKGGGFSSLMTARCLVSLGWFKTSIFFNVGISNLRVKSRWDSLPYVCNR